MGSFFSPGKLLLTSEYVVLDGALALAVPVKVGQELSCSVNENIQPLIFWEALHQGKEWLKAVIDFERWEITETNLPESAAFIMKVLREVQELSRGCFKTGFSYSFRTNLQFPADYGLGSSSTLMNNIAEWAGVDAFTLNENSLGGSGYDIAVAREKSAVLFKNSNGRKIVKKITFEPPFRDELIFIHLNQKQDSREGIQHYRSREKPAELTEAFSELTLKVLQCTDIEDFSVLMQLHEQKLSRFLNLRTALEKYFPGCPVFIKSLGAWGGDFVMSRRFPGFQEWFSEHGFPTIFGWNELIY